MINLSPVILFLQSWDIFFRNANAGAPPGAAYQSPPPLNGTSQGLASFQTLVGAQPNVEKLVEDHLAVQSLIRAYQVNHKHTWAVTRKNVCCHISKGFYIYIFSTLCPWQWHWLCLMMTFVYLDDFCYQDKISYTEMIRENKQTIANRLSLQSKGRRRQIVKIKMCWLLFSTCLCWENVILVWFIIQIIH